MYREAGAEVIELGSEIWMHVYTVAYMKALKLGYEIKFQEKLEVVGCHAA